MNPHGRIVACGAISRYNDSEARPGPHNLSLIVTRRLKIQGFIISDHEDHRPAFERDMARWLAEGKVRYRETVIEGIDRTPEAFLQLFSGDNIGKQIVRVG
jgi:NADPH-dependent curcumin reductase CurA